MSNKAKNLLYWLLVGLSSLYFSYIIINAPVDEEGFFFPDTADYVTQSRLGFTEGFFAPPATKYGVLHPRAFTVPLLYKFAADNKPSQTMMQKIVYCICVLSFIFSISLFSRNKILKLILHFVLLFFFSWWNIVGWSTILVSESLSISFLLLWLAAIAWNYYFDSKWSIALLLTVTVLFSFTRDSWPYVILLFFFLNFFIYYFSGKKNTRVNVLLFIFSMGLFALQNYSVNRGERSVLPVFNSIAGRVSQQQEYINWFSEKGMPQTQQVVADFRGVDVDSIRGRQIVYKRYYDSTYNELFDWIKRDGKSVYTKFLLTHWPYFFLTDQSKIQKEKIFATNIKGYHAMPQSEFLVADSIFPIFNLYFVVILVVVCFYFFIRSKRIGYLLPAVIAVLNIANALIVYNADALEVERHMFITGICTELTGILGIWLITEYAVSFYTDKKEKQSL